MPDVIHCGHASWSAYEAFQRGEATDAPYSWQHILDASENESESESASANEGGCEIGPGSGTMGDLRGFCFS